MTTAASSVSRYLQPAGAPPAPPAVRVLTAAIVLGSLAAGLGLGLVPVPAPVAMPGPARDAGTVHLVELPPPPAPDPVAEPQPEPESAPEPAPVLTPDTVLDAPVDLPVETPDAAPSGDPETAPAETEVRRVYGVRRVYARGLGAGGDPSGLVAKRGNTLAGPPDTLTATAADLAGRLAPLSTVDRAPEPLSRPQPAYSDAMRAARVSGTVEAWLLVGPDGSVRDVNVTSDIGADSRDVATAALRRFRFRPAERDGAPVAVWILHRIRFQFQE